MDIALTILVALFVAVLLILLGMAIAVAWELKDWLRDLYKSRRRYTLMATIVVNATKPITVKNPVVRTAKDSEGSPKPLPEPLPVSNFAIALENVEGNFGTVSDNGDGTWTFNPGDEIDEQAEGDLVFTGTVNVDGVDKPVEGRLSVELEPGEAVAFGAIEPELEVIEAP